MLHVPGPGTLDDGLDILVLGGPAKLATDLVRAGNKTWRITGAAWLLDGLDLLAGDGAAAVDDFLHGGSAAGAEIIEGTLLGVERENMGLGEIDNMDVVPDTAAVWRRVIRPVDLNRLFLGQGDLEHIRDEMRLDPVILSEGLARAGCIEIPQGHEGDAVEFAIPAEHLLEHELRLAVGIDRFLRKCLVDRHRLRNAEGGAGRGEDEALHPFGHHGLEQIHAVRHIVAEVLPGIGHRLTHQSIRGKMHDRFGF